MAGIWHDEGENNLLNAYFKGTDRPTDSWYLGLYKNTVALGESDGLAAITELSGYGYARQLIEDADWTVVDDLATGTQETFTASGGEWTDIYGWFLTNVVSGTAGKLLASEHFAAGPYTVPDTKYIKVTPKITAA